MSPYVASDIVGNLEEGTGSEAAGFSGNKLSDNRDLTLCSVTASAENPGRISSVCDGIIKKIFFLGEIVATIFCYTTSYPIIRQKQ